MLDSANPTNKSECEGCKAVGVCVDLVIWTQKKPPLLCVCVWMWPTAIVMRLVNHQIRFMASLTDAASRLFQGEEPDLHVLA